MLLESFKCFVWRKWQLPQPFFDHKENEKGRFGNKEHVNFTLLLFDVGLSADSSSAFNMPL